MNQINEVIESLVLIFIHLVHSYFISVSKMSVTVATVFSDICNDGESFRNHYDSNFVLEIYSNSIIIANIFSYIFKSAVLITAPDIFRNPFDFNRSQTESNQISFLNQYHKVKPPFQELPDDSPFDINVQNFRFLPEKEQPHVLFSSLPPKPEKNHSSSISNFKLIFWLGLGHNSFRNFHFTSC
jgi:hypothetical protein